MQYVHRKAEYENLIQCLYNMHKIQEATLSLG